MVVVGPLQGGDSSVMSLSLLVLLHLLPLPPVSATASWGHPLDITWPCCLIRLFMWLCSISVPFGCPASSHSISSLTFCRRKTPIGPAVYCALCEKNFHSGLTKADSSGFVGCCWGWCPALGQLVLSLDMCPIPGTSRELLMLLFL